ncbi:MAG TPA: hypothetical protein VG889_21385 [Rhizomicrobium sp.]|nr:hypothetical protein [Rhizomicrobium sp.]
MTSPNSKAGPKAELDAFLDRFTPELAKSTRGVLKAMRKLCPGATELVYDNYNALAVGFATGERVKDVWFSIAVYPKWASLFFFKTLPLQDPAKRLKGAGSTTRHIVLANGAATLAEPEVAALIDQALDKAGRPFAGGKSRIVIKSVSAKQRPRRPS